MVFTDTDQHLVNYCRTSRSSSTIPYSVDQLHHDVIVIILSFLADAPFETKGKGSQSTLTHVIPFVSKQFHQVAQYDDLWKPALFRQTIKEPLWREGLVAMAAATTCHGNDNKASCDTLDLSLSSTDDIISLALRSLSADSRSYKSLFRKVVTECVQFTGPILYKPGHVQLGQSYQVQFSGDYHRSLLDQALLELKNDESGLSSWPTLIHASQPFEPNIPACLVQIREMRPLSDGDGLDVCLMPVSFVWLRDVWTPKNTGFGQSLTFGRCVRMGKEATTHMKRLVQRESMVSVLEALVQQLGDGYDSFVESEETMALWDEED